jgi:hypothetical protein
MRILGRRTFVTTMWCVAIFSNQFSIPALAGGDQDLRTKVLIPRQIEVQPTIASSLVVQPPFVAFPAPPIFGSSTIEQTGEPQVANDSSNEDGPKNRDQPRRRALPAPLDGVFPSSEYLGPTPLIGVPDTDPVYPLTKALWSPFPALKRARIALWPNG